MRMLSLSPEICKRIVLNAYYWHDVLALCLTCKAFQKEAEVRIYNQLQLLDPRRAVLACNTVVENERLALHVRGFWFNQPNDRARPPDLGREFWSLIQKALIALSNLELLVLGDKSFSNGWILDNPAIQFRLKEAKLWFSWDVALTRFLEKQDTLRVLQFADALEDNISQHLAPRSLPNLRTFDGTFMVTAQVLSCPLVHLQAAIDTELEPILTLLPRMSNLRNTLRSLSLLDIPEEAATRVLTIISNTLPGLKHLGILPYPISRHYFIQHLMRMHNLKSIELDVSKWSPPPMIPGGQRALAAELQTYCSSIQMVSFWMGNTRVRWSHGTNLASGISQWQHRLDTQIYQQYSNTWSQF